jgi:uncharacterized protein with NAD-binding domain and iron-sulfur cluster
MKVVIIGGGPSALSAALELTEPGRGDHDVTILQPGWRLGGKCASGRNRKLGNRIEEHGLHIWFGSYDNAIALMTRCYDELGRDPQRYAFTSFENAFEGVDEAILWQRHGDEWSFKEVRFPRDPVRPLNFHSFAVRALDWAGSRFVELLEERRTEGRGLDVQSLRGDLPRLLEHVGIAELDEPGLVGSIGRAGSRVQRLVARAFSDVGQDFGVDVVEVADQFAEMVRRVVPEDWFEDPHVRFYLDTLDVVLAVLRGVWSDELLVNGFNSINDLDFADWLGAHGLELARDPENWPALLRALYCGCFAFEEGDTARPRMAAGRALQGAIRCVFHYQGSVLHRMRGAMGDTVIAPFYEVLARRGVDVRFFHAVKELLPGADGAIAEIRGVRQLTLDGPYEPLFDAIYSGDDGPRTVPAWPSEPLWEQLPKVKQAVKEAPLRLEQEIDPFKGSEFRLRKRTETDTEDTADVFDVVILAVPPDVQENICGALKEQDPGYAQMLDHSHTVVTQGAQLWLERSAHELGQEFSSRSLMSTYVEPLDTYCDMAHLLPNEQWPEHERARHIAYFCGVLATATMADQQTADADVQAHLESFVAEHVIKLWPSAVLRKGGFDYDLFAPAPTRPSRAASFSHQFWRANFAPAERYVLSLPGTIQHRLRAKDTRFDNLVLAGDWTANGFDAGCLEAAVTSGMVASNAICGEPRLDRIAGLNGPPGFPNEAPRRGPSAEPGPSLLYAGPRALWRALTGAAGAALAVGDEILHRLDGRRR